MDKQAQTLTVQDFGIGMTRDELVQNLGTIAHSGSLKFLKDIEGQRGMFVCFVCLVCLLVHVVCLCA